MARTGLTGFVAGLARSEIAARGVTINNLLPGAETDRLRTTLGGLAQKQGKSYEAIADGRRHGVPTWRSASRPNSGRSAPSQRAGRLHHGPERAGRRWRLSGTF